MRRLAVAIALILILQPAQLRAQQRVCEPARNPKELPAVGALVDSAGAVTALLSARFQPASIHGRAVRVRVHMPIDFTIKD